MTADSVVQNPDIKLEDVREKCHANRCTGRGGATAAPRGYNTERLASAVLDPEMSFFPYTKENWADTYVGADREVPAWVECKSCIYQYPSGGYGRFRIWKKHHKALYHYFVGCKRDVHVLYFFAVYTVENDIEKEVGKLVVPVEQVEETIEDWAVRDHSSMGEEEAKDISWRVFLKRLEVSPAQFENQDVIDLTDETPSEQEST